MIKIILNCTNLAEALVTPLNILLYFYNIFLGIFFIFEDVFIRHWKST